MRRALAGLLACLALSGPAGSQETIVAGLSQNRVAITASFVGSEILVYGAVRREAPPPDGGPMQVIVTVQGPSTALTLRRKERKLGIWLNNAAITVDAAPTFYAVATSGPIADILSGTEDLRYRITIPHAIRAIGSSAEAPDAPEFIAALQRIRESEGQYRQEEGAVEFLEETLFRADVELPANLTEGDYQVRMFLTRDGRVVDQTTQVIDVRKAGLERMLYRMAHDQPFLYGILSLVLAAVAGWGASAGFRLLRR